MTHDGNVISAGRLSGVVLVDNVAKDGNTLALGMDNGVVQDSHENIKTTGSGRLLDAVSGSDDVVSVKNGTGTDVAILAEEYPLDQADLGEFSLQCVDTTNDAA